MAKTTLSFALETLRTQIEMACESHNEQERRERLNRVFGTVLRELKSYNMDANQKEMLVEIFRESARHDAGTTVIRSGNFLTVHGEFDIRELARRMVWKGVFEPSLRDIAEQAEATDVI
jgi:hypothetical protein